MNSKSGLVAAALVGLVIGYFVGREHLKYEMRTALSAASAGIADAFSSNSGDDSDQPSERARVSSTAPTDTGADDDSAKTSYIAERLELYDLSAEYIKTYSGRVPGVLFKLRNSGEQTLDKVEVTVYFKDSDGNIIAEEDFYPVLVTKYSVSDSKPLRPGYIWQMESGKYYTAKNVPSEWKEGMIEAAITDIRFAE